MTYASRTFLTDIQKIGFLENELLQTQIDVWIAGLEADETELAERMEIEAPLQSFEDTTEMFGILNKSMETTSCGESWRNVLKHFLLLPTNPVQRLRYMFVIDRVIQQITIQRNGEDPDPNAALAELDFRAIVTDLLDTDQVRTDEEKLKKQMEKTRKLEKDLIVTKAELEKGVSPVY